MADLGDILRRLESLERVMAELYHAYAQRFAGDPEAAALFRQLETEEGSHETLARFQRNLVARNRALFPDVDLRPAEVDGLQARVEAHLREASPSLGEAVAFAWQAEQAAGEAHTFEAMHASNPDVADFVRVLARGDQEHAGRLRRFAEGRGLALEG